jgi:hypothetical protein
VIALPSDWSLPTRRGSVDNCVPPDAPLGANGLFWALDPFGLRAPQLHARVTIDR